MASQIVLPTRKGTENRHTWHGKAFIVEALVVLFFIVVSIAVVMQLLTLAQNEASKANTLSYASILASNEAEAFSADPAKETHVFYRLENGILVPTQDNAANNYEVSRKVSREALAGGTLYHGTIEVRYSGEKVFETASSRYVSIAGVG